MKRDRMTQEEHAELAEFLRQSLRQLAQMEERIDAVYGKRSKPAILIERLYVATDDMALQMSDVWGDQHGAENAVKTDPYLHNLMHITPATEWLPPPTKPRLSPEEHQAFGAFLKRCHDHFIHMEVRVANTHGKTKAPRRQATRLVKVLGKLRSTLDDLVDPDFPPGTSGYELNNVYYGKREKAHRSREKNEKTT